jgi:hypothetical protein
MSDLLSVRIGLSGTKDFPDLALAGILTDLVFDVAFSEGSDLLAFGGQQRLEICQGDQYRPWRVKAPDDVAGPVGKYIIQQAGKVGFGFG